MSESQTEENAEVTKATTEVTEKETEKETEKVTVEISEKETEMYSEEDTEPEEEKDAYHIYKEYFYDHFNENVCRVYFADLTHDGTDDEMIVLKSDGSGDYFYVYTVNKGKVYKVDEYELNYHIEGIYVFDYGEYSNIGLAIDGIYQGYGQFKYQEYSYYYNKNIGLFDRKTVDSEEIECLDEPVSDDANEKFKALVIKKVNNKNAVEIYSNKFYEDVCDRKAPMASQAFQS